MYIEDNDAFLEARFKARLTDAFGRMTMENGDPFADALADAITLDRREAGVPAERLVELDDEAIIDAIAELDWLLFGAEGTAEGKLPFGTVVRSANRGGLSMGARHYVLETGRPGLHAIEGVRRDAHGPNLDLLRRMIRRRTAKLACRRIGLPSAASVFDSEPRQMLQFPPCAEAGGVVLQRSAYGTGAERFGAATPSQISAFADGIVADMRALWRKRGVVAERASAIRAATLLGVDEVGADAPVALRAITVDMTQDHGDGPPPLYVEMNGLDESLRPGVILDYAPGDRVDWECSSIRSQPDRRAHAATLRERGADGWIDAVAAAVAAACPDGAGAALAPLADALESYVAMPTSGGLAHATFFWRDGTVRVEFDLPGAFFVSHRHVEVSTGSIPETVLAAMVGRSLSDVLDAPIRCDATVAGARSWNGGFRLELAEREARQLLVDLRSGRIW